MPYLIDTPFGRYEPKVPDDDEMDHAARIMADVIGAIARVNHDQWAVERIKQGWRYGPDRDDHKKLHPDLIAYEHLLEDEKKLDVQGAKAIVAELLRLKILRP